MISDLYWPQVVSEKLRSPLRVCASGKDWFPLLNTCFTMINIIIKFLVVKSFLYNSIGKFLCDVSR